MAKALGGQGVKVAVLNRTQAKGEAVAEAIRAAGSEAMAVSADVLDDASLIAVRDQVVAAWGGVDILVNGAGGNDPKATTAAETWLPPDPASDGGAGNAPAGLSFFDLDSAAFSQVFDLNFQGTFRPTRIFAAAMLGRPGATIINVSSMGSYQPMTKVPAYCAAKAAVNNFTNWLAVHFAPAGLRVNAIAPGFFSTEQNKHLLWTADGQPTPRTKKILEHTPLRRLGDPSDLCGALLWLCDPVAAGFVTGTVIPVDGGFLAYSGV
jgi:NAD(P)-dependent dehydrogenase (short-subunit alcohol dehydrogenase family)